MRKQRVGVVRRLERVEPRELALRVPAQGPLVAVPVVDVDFDVGGAGAAGGDEEAAGVAADFGGGGGEGLVGEADVEEAEGGGKKVGLAFFFLL